METKLKKSFKQIIHEIVIYQVKQYKRGTKAIKTKTMSSFI